MVNEYCNGGLKMPYIQTFNRALKSKWIQKYLDGYNHGKWKLFFDAHLVRHGGKQLFSFNLKKGDILTLQIQDLFLEEVLEIWAENFEQNPKDIYKTPVWYNSLIKVNRVPFFYKNGPLQESTL